MRQSTPNIEENRRGDPMPALREGLETVQHVSKARLVVFFSGAARLAPTCVMVMVNLHREGYFMVHMYHPGAYLGSFWNAREVVGAIQELGLKIKHVMTTTPHDGGGKSLYRARTSDGYVMP